MRKYPFKVVTNIGTFIIYPGVNDREEAVKMIVRLFKYNPMIKQSSLYITQEDPLKNEEIN